MDLEGGGGNLKTFKNSFTLKFGLFNFHSEHLNCSNPENHVCLQFLTIY